MPEDTDRFLPTSVETLMANLGCDHEEAEDLQAIEHIGYMHGARGFYPDGDYSSDADWCHGVGSLINTIENDLGIEDGTVFDLYVAAHGLGLKKHQEKRGEDVEEDQDVEEHEEEEEGRQDET